MTQTKTTDIQDWYLTNFAGFESRLNGRSDAPVQSLRKRAIDHFAATDFPTSHDEDWRHTNLGPITRVRFEPWSDDQTGRLDREDIAPFILDDLDCQRLVFVNGQYAAQLSDAESSDGKATVTHLRQAIENRSATVDRYLGQNVRAEQHGFSALNTAFLDDGALIHVPANVHAEKPIHLIFLSVAGESPSVSFPRSLIVLEAGAEATVIETFAGTTEHTYLTNAATEVFLEEKAVLQHCRIQRESGSAFHVADTAFRESGGSRLFSHNIDLGARLCRNDIVTRLEGERIESSLNGLYVADGEQHVDNHTLIEHAAPNSASYELFKGVLGQKSTGVFRGKIHVLQIAQKTDAYQSNQNLLLSDDADITSKPQLEIYADDVKCSHGSTTGQLDTEAIFYLRTRGIADEAARGLLTRAFADEILDRIQVEQVVRQLRRLVADKLQSLHQQGL